MQVPETLAKGSAQWKDWEENRTALIASHRHEDGLLNSRLTGFLTATAFLLTVFTLARVNTLIAEAAMVLCMGAAFSWDAAVSLLRTSKVIEWHIDAVMRIEKALWPEDNGAPFRMYWYRRERMKDHDRDPAGNGKLAPVSVRLGLIPVAVFLGWVFLGINTLRP